MPGLVALMSDEGIPLRWADGSTPNLDGEGLQGYLRVLVG